MREGWCFSRYAFKDRGIVALVMRLKGYLIGSGVLGRLGAECLGKESERAGITGVGCPRAALISASNARVVS